MKENLIFENENLGKKQIDKSAKIKNNSDISENEKILIDKNINKFLDEEKKNNKSSKIENLNNTKIKIQNNVKAENKIIDENKGNSLNNSNPIFFYGI